MKVTQNAAVFKGAQHATPAIDKVVQELSSASRINFTPTWFQVFPGVDLLGAADLEPGHLRQRCRRARRQRGRRQLSAGIAADIYQKYRIDLKYNGYYGNYSTNPTGATSLGGVMGVPNGANSSLSDRGWVSLTFKTTF